MSDPVRRPGLRQIAVVTVGRSDFSILRPLVTLLQGHPALEAGFWVGGAHFDPVGGFTLRDIEASGLPIWARIEAPVFGHGAGDAVAAMAAQLAGFGRMIDGLAQRPDLVLILGDRFEALAAGLACLMQGLPVGHLSGGSVTEGAVDDVFRHALTKVAALHFCDLPDFARRIHQMGEEPWRIFTVGALGLDGIHAAPPRPLAALRAEFGLTGLDPGYVLATLHSETRAVAESGPMAAAMVEALAATGRQVIYTWPNADAGAEAIIPVIEAAARTHPGHFAIRNFGSAWFYTAMAHAGLVIGNSSSGIYEAGSFRLPVLDIGDRQKARFHGRNVLHCDRSPGGIAAGIARATDPAFVAGLADFVNPYGDGQAARRVIAALEGLDWPQVSAAKPFAAFDPQFSGAPPAA